MKIGLWGAGSWGTALGKVWAEKGLEVWLWARNTELVEAINTKAQNPVYLPGVSLPVSLKATADFSPLLEAELWVWAVPCQALRSVLEKVALLNPPPIPMISAIKGLEITTGKTPCEVLEEFFPSHPKLVLSGPSFAQEVAQGLPTAVVLAGSKKELVQRLQEILSLPYFRIYRSGDLKGVELCGAVKNVIAIAAGISDGLALGLNARAALITRGLNEMRRLGAQLGAQPMTFSGLAGIGDLVLTCTGPLSRNYRVGKELGQGKDLGKILQGLGQVAEGVETVKALHRWIRKWQVEMPISEAVYRVLYEGEPPLTALKKLLARPLKAEFEDPL